MARKPAFVQNRYRSGMYDRPNINLPLTYCQNIENMVVDRETLKSRGGISAFANGYSYPGEIQAVRQFWSNSGTPHTVVVSEGRVFRYDHAGSNPTEVTNGQTLSASADARVKIREYDGGAWITDNVNPIIYLPDESSGAVLFSTLNPGRVPSRAGAIEFFENSLWLGNFTDFNEAATARRYATIQSQLAGETDGIPGIAQFLAEQGARNDHNRAQAVQELLEHDDGDLLIFQERGIRRATFDPAPEQIGLSRTDFYYKTLTKESGLVAPNAAITTPLGTFYLDRRGPYWIPPGNPPQKPKYIGLPIETFWSGVDQNRLAYANVTLVPELNGVMWNVPVGSATTQNNRAIFAQFASWTNLDVDIESLHPAMSIFKGTGARPFSFNAACHILDPESSPAYRKRCIVGDYNGKLWYLDEGTSDAGEDIICLWKPAKFGSPDFEWHWESVAVDMNLEAAKVLQMTATPYATGAASDMDTVSAGTTYPGIGSGGFQIGVSAIAGSTLGRARADVQVEPAPYLDLTCRVASNSLPVQVHQMLVFGKPGGSYN